MNDNSISELKKLIDVIAEKTYNKISGYEFYPKILLIGNIGSGKSAIMNCLTKHELIIVRGKSKKKIQLDGEGIRTGCKAGTIEPEIYLNHENQIMFCDCVGFNDPNGIKSEIPNSFSYDCLCARNGNDNYIKILLVVSESEIQSNRGSFFVQTIERLNKMFPNPDELKDGIGLIITQGDPDLTGIDHIDYLEDDAPFELAKWCSFFKNNPDHVFTFPKALEKDIDNIYDFDDHQRLIDFVTKDYLVNLEHNIALNNESLYAVEKMRSDHINKLENLILALFLQIHEQYRQSSHSSKIKEWLDIMHLLLDKKIKMVKDFSDVIKKFIPESDRYHDFFVELDKLESFDLFFDKILKKEEESSCLQETFRRLVHGAIKELEKNMISMQSSEMQKQNLQEKNAIIKKFEVSEKNNLRRINELETNTRKMQEENERIQKDNQAKIAEFLDLKKATQEEIEKYIESINQLKSDLDEWEQKSIELENKSKCLLI